MAFGRSNLCTDSQIKPHSNNEEGSAAIDLKKGSGPCKHDWGSALMVEENKRLKSLNLNLTSNYSSLLE